MFIDRFTRLATGARYLSDYGPMIHLQSQNEGCSENNDFALQTHCGRPDETVFWPYLPEQHMGEGKKIPESEREYLIASQSDFQRYAWVCPWFRERAEVMREEGVILTGGTLHDCFQSAISVLEHLEIPWNFGGAFH
jgi:hypothetical protein